MDRQIEKGRQREQHPSNVVRSELTGGPDLKRTLPHLQFSTPESYFAILLGALEPDPSFDGF